MKVKVGDVNNKPMKWLLENEREKGTPISGQVQGNAALIMVDARSKLVFCSNNWLNLIIEKFLRSKQFDEC